ncbi:MAG: hypothetical protein IT174_11330 [Acidobacteria bacterium]|nr:hypothetical protein [Acidobacteriota bacterium]
MTIRFLALVAVLGATGCLQESVSSGDKLVRSAGTPDLAVNSTPHISEPAVKLVGVYSNTKSDGTHSSGFRIKLWKHNDNLLGLISGSPLAISGDLPTGRLNDLHLDQETKQLSFNARLSMGKTYDEKSGLWVWSRDTLQFDGKLEGGSIVGMLISADANCPDTCYEKQKAVFRITVSDGASMDEFSTYPEWERYVNEILARRGPRW